MYSAEFPLAFSGLVVSGFGRGGKELGCPTANLDDSVVDALPASLPCGVFYGLARVEGGPICDMVMSIGWNPHFKNEKKTVEVHLMSEFKKDFYGSNVDCVTTGYLREMLSFSGLDELKTAIQNDISTARSKLTEVNRDEIFRRFFPSSVIANSHL